MKKRKVKRKPNIQKIFSFISFIFILICILWYGGRLIYFYLDSKKDNTNNNTNLLSSHIISSKNKNIKKINNNYYFTGNVDNNYVLYSNILWRIIKISNDNKIYLITDNSITSLSYGENTKYEDSQIIKWLNKDGILDKNLNNTTNYLDNYNVCIDEINDVKKVTCNDNYNENTIGLLSVTDYVNTGGQNSFINTEEYTYLANNTKDNEIWYITNEGKLNKNDGTDYYGIKPVITLKSTTKLNSGDGTINNPYIIDTNKSLFASYVKLDNDIWRVYEEDNNNVKLMLTDYLKINNERISYNYSKINYYHNDTIKGNLAYYLNTTYLNSLSYKNLILDNNYSNGYDDSNYDYTKILEQQINTKVSTISIGYPILVNKLDSIWTNTGVSKESDVYIIKDNSKLEPTSVDTENYIVPCITIKKSLLTKGNGTKNTPYEVEE